MVYAGRISIHAPREGGDETDGHYSRRYRRISIHAPREGGDAWNLLWAVEMREFQSTPPARGATTKASGGRPVRQISIHAPREGGDHPHNRCNILDGVISIHAPREGGDCPVF